MAFVLLAAWPQQLGGFFYHPRLIAVVHLVTLGWISSSILGALYLVCPLAFRTPLPESRADLLAFVAWAVGVAGAASHFWVERYGGLAWAGGLALLAYAWPACRVLRALPRAPVPLEARLPFGLALANFFLAGGLGVLLGINKHAPFLPFSQMGGVLGHLHLAAVGWATMMVMGAGYRVLPMVLPSAMPRGRAALSSALLLQGGVLGLAGALALGGPLVRPFAIVTLVGLGLFVSRLAFMLRHRRPPPTARLRPDWSVLHLGQSFLCLLAAAGLGLYLAWTPDAEAALRAAMVYGVLGLVGFLSQIIVGVEARILPLAAWLQAFARGGYAELPPSPHRVLPHRTLGIAFLLWALGVPGLAAGLALDIAALTAVAAAGLALAVLASALATGRGLLALRPNAKSPGGG
ncbi:MAG TPA: hypothetical protein VFM88_22260 [Vicinamibacteria bacterium]|nr:hypothetical protein [Vicinamibacteria bacterium]